MRDFFIELSSHAADLTQARRALEMAIDSRDPDTPLREAAAYLTGFAVVAYWRCFGQSKVRRPLTDHIEIPAELIETHERVRAFRNATIAHSQSDLAVTYPLGFLDPRTLEVQFVSGPTIVNTLPGSMADQFWKIMEALQQRLDEAIHPVRTRLEAGLRTTEPGQLLATSRPTAIHKLAKDFNPRSRRKLYPDSHPVYWVEDP